MCIARKPRLPRQRRVHQRSVELLAEVESGLWFVRITQDGKEAFYWLRRIGSDWGDGFRLQKVDAYAYGMPVLEEYDLRLSNDGHYCCCLGHEHHGYCKHVDALVACGGGRWCSHGKHRLYLRPARSAAGAPDTLPRHVRRRAAALPARRRAGHHRPDATPR